MPAPGALKRQGWTEEERKEIYDYANAHPDLTWRVTAFFTSSRAVPGPLYLILPLPHVNSLI
ncbi:hypothetical protein BGX38DRAFT_1230274 [Terfezia claveryi]|nr:hypothetical protein BGX38DRAFT_1230274 [Terfezia claveryi]